MSEPANPCLVDGATKPAGKVVNGRAHTAALWMAIASVGIWGLNFPLQKSLFAEVGPIAFLGMRYLIVPVCCVALLCWRFGLKWPRLPRRDLLFLAGLALLGQGVHVVLAAVGLSASNAFSASVLHSCGPAFTIVLAALAGVERPHRLQVVGLLIAALGVLAFTGQKWMGASWHAGAGDLILLFAALLFSVYTVAGKGFSERHGAIVLMAYGGLAATLPMLVFTAPALWAMPAATLPLGFWVATMASVVSGSFLGWLGWSHAIEVRGVARTAPLIYLSPVIAGLSGWAWLGEVPSGWQAVAALVVLMGVATAQLSARRVRWGELQARPGR